MVPKIYLKNLHAFRFFAATAVIITHLELFKSRSGIPNIWKHPLVLQSGSAGVDFFFVLSGFLITTLLLAEKEYSGTINLKKFYWRRILRIWPLYYIFILFCFLVIPYIPLFYIKNYSELLQPNFGYKFAFSMFMMPNVALTIFGKIPYAGPAWSIGVEEQFYLIWPFIVLPFFKELRNISLFILIFIAIKVGLFAVSKAQLLEVETFTRVKDFFISTRMECMGIGGAGAVIMYQKSKFSNILMNNKTALLLLLSLPLVLYFADFLFELHHIILSIIFLVIICNSTSNSKTFIKLENPILYWLGNISYGLYLLHPISIGISLAILREVIIYKPEVSIWYNIALYGLTFSITVIIAHFSYKYFEKRFLNLKRKYTVIISGDDAKTTQLKSERRNFSIIDKIKQVS